MASPLESLIACGTKLWLDSIDPELVERDRSLGATGATSNPIIVADLIESGRFDGDLWELAAEGLDDETIAWRLTDRLVSAAERVFLPVWQQTGGDDGYVSFEVDPLLEDPETGPPPAARTARYVELAEKWAAGHTNRLIKIPATPAGLAALEEVVAAGVNVNVTLVFTDRQYRAARDAVMRGAKRLDRTDSLKSVYSIFVSRVDVYTQQHAPQLGIAQGQVGIVGAKQIWAENEAYWPDKKLALKQEIVFASTGTKTRDDPPWKYVDALAGSDIQTNPPGTNAAVQASGRTFSRRIDTLIEDDVRADIREHVDVEHLESTLMREGVKKFADPQKALLELIARRRVELTVDP